MNFENNVAFPILSHLYIVLLMIAAIVSASGITLGSLDDLSTTSWCLWLPLGLTHGSMSFPFLEHGI